MKTDKISKILSESISELILEYAYHRKDFTEKIDNLTTEIIRNYALICYAKKYNIQTINHWRSELITLITIIQDMETKPKRGNRDMVYKAILKVWISQMELNTHPLTVIHRYIGKFNDENITLSADEHMEIAQSFIDNIDELAKEMAYGNYDSALKFANKVN